MSLLLRIFGVPYLYNPEAPLLQLTPKDRWRVRDAYEAVAIFGALGGGKSSGSGKAIAKAYLRAGWGGLVCCAKGEEADLWRRYAKETGRSKDLMVMSVESEYRCNYMQYEMARSPDSGSLVMNLVGMLTNIIAAANGNIGSSGGGDNQFWEKASREALTRIVEVLWHAYGQINLYDLFAVIHTRAMSREEAHKPEWKQHSFMAAALERLEKNPVHPMPAQDQLVIAKYMTEVLSNPDPKTVGNMLATMSADLSPLLTGSMREIFSTGTNIVPEMTHEGKIIVLDFPVNVYGQAGALAQHIFKLLWQKSMVRRKVDKKTRPAFLWCDEAQLFVSPYDAEFQSVARSARAATVYLTQNLPNLYNRVGGRHPEHTIDALLGNFQTKIFHANGCAKTNQWAAEMVGKGLQIRWSGGIADNYSWNVNSGGNVGRTHSSGSQPGGYTSGASWGEGYGGGGSSNIGYSEQMDYIVQPSTFTMLRKGGKSNRMKVDGLIFQGGNKWIYNNSTVLPLTFNQRG